MSLHVGGIHVRAPDPTQVVNAIQAFWLQVGAAPLEEGIDPLALEPLSSASKTTHIANGRGIVPLAPCGCPM